MSEKHRVGPECRGEKAWLNRRSFLKVAGVGAATAAAAPRFPAAIAADPPPAAAGGAPETVVKLLYDSLSAPQRKEVCFEWDYVDPGRGLLRTRVANNWQITGHFIRSDFYTPDQQAMIRKIFEGIVAPDWVERFDKQLRDDAGGFGARQSIAIFGKPGQDKFEFVLSGRHMTLRCDGNSAEHVAFGGPIFYGHAASGFNEKPDHPGNIFWHQALAANRVFQILDGKQQQRALLPNAPEESRVGFRGPDGQFPGIPIAELSPDQRQAVQEVLKKLIEPYRPSDRDEALACLNAQGGLDRCSLAFYQEGDLGSDRVWDIWRLEGPAFVWHFRGAPHVHTWVNVADDPTVKLNA